MIGIHDVEDGVYRGWVRPGPVPPRGVDVESGETLDYLCGHWRIFQYERGHRYSVDDVLLAHYGTTYAPRVDRMLDLGSGISSVALCAAWRLPGAHVVTIEAQEMSMRLATKSIRYNGVAARFTQLLGDMRESVDQLRVLGPFDLVTGSPPYWPTTHALAAQHEQAVGARLETRGDVADYAATAAKLLAPGGAFAIVHQASQDARVRAAIAGAGLTLIRTRPVAFKEGVSPSTSGIQLYMAMRTVDVPHTFHGSQAGKPVVESTLLLRTAAGTVSPEYATLRLSYGFPPGDVGPEKLADQRP